MDKTLRGFVADMPTEHLQCRDFGHSWQPWTANFVQHGCFESVLRCIRCQTTRTRLLGPRGQVLASGYDYADGYLMKGVGRLAGPDKDSLRLASIRRLLNGNGKGPG